MSIKVGFGFGFLVFCLFVFALTSQYRLSVRNCNSGLEILNVERAIEYIPSLLTKLPFTQWRNSQILLLRSDRPNHSRV